MPLLTLSGILTGLLRHRVLHQDHQFRRFAVNGDTTVPVRCNVARTSSLDNSVAWDCAWLLLEQRRLAAKGVEHLGMRLSLEQGAFGAGQKKLAGAGENSVPLMERHGGRIGEDVCGPFRPRHFNT